MTTIVLVVDSSRVEEVISSMKLDSHKRLSVNVEGLRFHCQ
jgi:hypothetical protein